MRYRVRLFGQRLLFASLLEAMEFHQDLARNGLDADCIFVDQLVDDRWEAFDVPLFLSQLSLLLAPAEEEPWPRAKPSWV